MASSQLQSKTVRELDRVFGCHAIQENVRPEWLISPDGARLELDIFIPQAALAIEVQGAQHYRFVPHFHGNAEGFARRLRHDECKRAICHERGIVLHEVASDEDLNVLLAKLRGVELPPDPKYLTQQEKRIRRRDSRNFKDFARHHLHGRHRKQRNAKRRLSRAIRKGASETKIRQLELEAANTKQNFESASQKIRKEYHNKKVERILEAMS